MRDSGLACLLSIALGTEERRQQAQGQAWAAPGAPRAQRPLFPGPGLPCHCLHGLWEPRSVHRLLAARAPSPPPPRPHSSSSSLGLTDQEAIQELESSLKEIRKTASWIALYYAGLFLWLMGRHDKAKEYTDRMLQLSSGAREVLTTGSTRTTARESSVATHQSRVAIILTEGHGRRGRGAASPALPKPWVSK